MGLTVPSNGKKGMWIWETGPRLWELLAGLKFGKRYPFMGAPWRLLRYPPMGELVGIRLWDRFWGGYQLPLRDPDPDRYPRMGLIAPGMPRRVPWPPKGRKPRVDKASRDCLCPASHRGESRPQVSSSRFRCRPMGSWLGTPST